jgi:histidine ammonia-lyase
MIEFGLSDLNFDFLSRALSAETRYRLSEAAKMRIMKCREYLDEKIQSQTAPLYGINTGFGALCDKSVSRGDLNALQHNLVMSHACGTGNEVSPEIVRLMLMLKIHALSLGYSGVCLDTVELMIELLNRNILPVVYDRGSLGASGDLAPLANMSLPLTGMGKVRVNGQLCNSSDALRNAGLRPVEMQAKEGLALLNGTQFMSSHGTLACLTCSKLLELADLIAALSLDVYDGSLEPFRPHTHSLRPHRGQRDTADNVCRLLDGSEIMASHKRHVQDPYSFRCVPQVHGATKDTLNYVSSVILTEINSVTDNPIIFPDEDLIVSGGNFHGQPLALVMDFLAIAVAELGNISERRISQLILGKRGLPEFLTSEPGLNSGFMIPQYSAAAMVSQNKIYCTPASVDSIVSSNGQEDHVSMGANAATKLMMVIDNVQRILSVELMTAAQALEFRRPLRTSPVLEDFIAKYREVTTFAPTDRFFGEDMEKTREFLCEWRIEN